MTSHGTVNALFRLEELVLRFPIERGETHRKRAWLEAEADAARRLVGRVPFPTPEPLALGEPGHGYPLPWAVYAGFQATTRARLVSGTPLSSRATSPPS